MVKVHVRFLIKNSRILKLWSDFLGVKILSYFNVQQRGDQGAMRDYLPGGLFECKIGFKLRFRVVK